VIVHGASRGAEISANGFACSAARCSENHRLQVLQCSRASVALYRGGLATAEMGTGRIGLYSCGSNRMLARGVVEPPEGSRQASTAITAPITMPIAATARIVR
jgi:hypothetical protein